MTRMDDRSSNSEDLIDRIQNEVKSSSSSGASINTDVALINYRLSFKVNNKGIVQQEMFFPM